MELEQRTIEILAQVVYKEMCEDRRKGIDYGTTEQFWIKQKEETLELARNIIRVNRTINPQIPTTNRI